MNIYFASDHAGLAHKDKVFAYLVEHTDYQLTDFGPFEFDAKDDYPDYISLAARRVARETHSIAIIFGGSGQGEAILANRFQGVRAAVYYGGDKDILRLSKEHNNANVLSIGSRFVSDEEVVGVVKEWLDHRFTHVERHERRLKKLEQKAKMGLKEPAIERFGWIGVILIVSAYVANIFGVLLPNDTGYLMANVVGSLFVMIDARQDNNTQAVVINAVWILAGLIGMFHYFLL